MKFNHNHAHGCYEQSVLQWAGWIVSWLVEHILLEKNSTFYLTCTFIAREDSIAVVRRCTREKGAVLWWAGWLVELMGLA